MSDDYADDYGDTDPNNIPDGDSDGRDTDASAPDPRSAGDGLPGYPVDGHPDWRAGVFGSSDNLLGLRRLSDLVARSQDGPAVPGGPFARDDAPFEGRADPRLMQVSDPVLDQEQNSWRWNDPEALAYDINRKKTQLAQAQALSLGSFGGSVAQQGLADIGKVAPPAEAIGFPSPLAWAGIALGGYMGFAEVPRLENEIKALQTRLDQIRARSKA